MNPSFSPPPSAIGLRAEELSSNGPPLILIHGVTRCWQTFLPVLAPLTQCCSVHGIHQRGHALSDSILDETLRSKAPIDYRVTAYVDDLVEFIEERFNEPVMLWGHSLGAMVALGAVGKLGSKVSGAILEDPPLHTMGRRLDQSRLFSYFSGLRELLRSRRELRELIARMKKLAYVDPVTLSSTLLEQVRDEAGIHFSAWCASRLDPRVLDPIVQLNWLDGFDWEEAASQSTAAMLICQADPNCGGMLTDADSELLMAKLHARATSQVACCVRFSGTGHTIHDAKPAEISAKAILFLETLRPLR